MKYRTLCAALSSAAGLSLAAPAIGQGTMYGLQFNGGLFTIDLGTGAATFVGSTGRQFNGGASDSQGRLYGSQFLFPDGTDIYEIDPATGSVLRTITPVGHPVGTTIRGMDFDANDVLYAAFSPTEITLPDTLCTVDLATGAVTQIGSMIEADVQGLAFHPDGRLFAIGVNTQSLLSVNTATGAATRVGGSNFGGDSQALEFDASGTGYICRVGLRTIDVGTGAATLVGSTGQSDFRGLAFVGGALPCYPDCDTSTGVGVLDIFDFLCFQNRYDAGASYACDCDLSTGPGVCDIFDFLCFQNAYDKGCP